MLGMFSPIEILAVLAVAVMFVPVVAGIGVIIYMVVRKAARDGARDAARIAAEREQPR